MEKLKAAVDAARSSRDELTAPPVGTSETARQQSKVAPTCLERWQALAPLTLQEKHLFKHRVVTRLAGRAAAPFDILRTKTLLQMRQNGWKRLAITSPLPRAGKTTAACNLALGLGRQSDLRSILFDLDLRDPRVQDFFETTPPHGIGEVLKGAIPFEKQALRYGNNLAVSMAQKGETDPTRILLSEETMSTLNAIEETYQPDLMIFDLPSVLVNDDTRAFLKNADCALIVVRADKTYYEKFEACRREIEQLTNVLGVVLNAYRHDKRSSR